MQVQASAGRALGAAAKAFPLCGPTLLSSLLFYIKRAVECLCSGAIPAGTEMSAAQTCLVLLSAVPSLATSQAATGAVLAALKPLAAAGPVLSRRPAMSKHHPKMPMAVLQQPGIAAVSLMHAIADLLLM